MKTYCLFCQKYTNNSSSRFVKDKKRSMLKSNCSVYGNKKNMFRKINTKRIKKRIIKKIKR